MNKKEKQLASQMLGELSDILSNRMCNDWEYPVDWSEEEKISFTKAFHEWNGDIKEFDPLNIWLSNFAVAGYLAYLISIDS